MIKTPNIVKTSIRDTIFNDDITCKVCGKFYRIPIYIPAKRQAYLALHELCLDCEKSRRKSKEPKKKVREKVVLPRVMYGFNTVTGRTR